MIILSGITLVKVLSGGKVVEDGVLLLLLMLLLLLLLLLLVLSSLDLQRHFSNQPVPGHRRGYAIVNDNEASMSPGGEGDMVDPSLIIRSAVLGSKALRCKVLWSWALRREGATAMIWIVPTARLHYGGGCRSAG